MDPRVRSILMLVRHGRGPINFAILEESQRLGLSQAHLNRLFRREVGTGFRSYLRTLRMKTAAKLLQDQTRAIKAIAQEIGYSDVSNFYHDFHAAYGISPRQFRLSKLNRLMDRLERRAS
jgi:AraC-like DNA-binding protein